MTASLAGHAVPLAVRHCKKDHRTAWSGPLFFGLKPNRSTPARRRQYWVQATPRWLQQSIRTEKHQERGRDLVVVADDEVFVRSWRGAKRAFGTGLAAGGPPRFSLPAAGWRVLGAAVFLLWWYRIVPHRSYVKLESRPSH